MIVITDVNKIFSATYTPNGTEANMLASKSGIQFLAPDYLIEEFENHIDEISESMGYSKKRYQKAVFESGYPHQTCGNCQDPQRACNSSR